jgi:hypothetical protein
MEFTLESDPLFVATPVFCFDVFGFRKVPFGGAAVVVPFPFCLFPTVGAALTELRLDARGERRFVLGNSTIRRQARMARGIHRLLKVSLGPAMPYPSTPCGRATPEGVARRAGDLRPSSTLLATPCHMGLSGGV